MDVSFYAAPVMLIQKPTHRRADRTVSQQHLALQALISPELRQYSQMSACANAPRGPDAAFADDR